MIKKFIFAFLCIFCLFLFSAEAAVIFEDNFDAQDDWTVTQTTSDETCYTGSCAGTSPPTNWEGYRNGRSYCTGAPGSNNIYIDEYAGYPIDTDTCRGGSGKCVTFWQESCTNAFEDSDGILLFDLGAEYQEIYIRFYILLGNQVDDDFFELVAEKQTKIVRAHHYLSGNPFVTAANNQGNMPYWSYKFYAYNNNEYDNGSPRGWCDLGDGDAECYYMGHAASDTTSPEYTYNSAQGADISQIGAWSSYLGDGNWHSIEVHLKMNTYDGGTPKWNADGVQEVWFDGVKHLARADVPFNLCDDDETPCADETSPPRGWLHVAIGGNNNNRWTSSCSGTGCEQWYAIDDVVISTTYIGVAPAAIVSGTAVDGGVTEAQIKAGGETSRITLLNDTWPVAAGGLFDAQRQNNIDGFDSGGIEGTGWNAEIRDKEIVGSVIRTSDTVMTITWTANGSFEIIDPETITYTACNTCTAGEAEIIGSPIFEITASNPTAVITDTFSDGATEAQVVTGGANVTAVITLSDDTWRASMCDNSATTNAFFQAWVSDGPEAGGWNIKVADVLVDAVAAAACTRDTATQVTVVFPATADFVISANETVTLTIPAADLVTSDSPLEASPTMLIGDAVETTEKITGITMQ